MSLIQSCAPILAWYFLLPVFAAIVPPCLKCVKEVCAITIKGIPMCWLWQSECWQLFKVKKAQKTVIKGAQDFFKGQSCKSPFLFSLETHDSFPDWSLTLKLWTRRVRRKRMNRCFYLSRELWINPLGARGQKLIAGPCWPPSFVTLSVHCRVLLKYPSDTVHTGDFTRRLDFNFALRLRKGPVLLKHLPACWLAMCQLGRANLIKHTVIWE